MNDQAQLYSSKIWKNTEKNSFFSRGVKSETAEPHIVDTKRKEKTGLIINSNKTECIICK